MDGFLQDPEGNCVGECQQQGSVPWAGSPRSSALTLGWGAALKPCSELNAAVRLKMGILEFGTVLTADLCHPDLCSTKS